MQANAMKNVRVKSHP
jgi:hypothetical protein